MKISLLLIGILVCIAGVAFFGIGPKLGITHPEPFAVLIIGIGIVLIGLDGIATARSTTGSGVTRITHYGWSARLRGAGFALLGLVLAAGSVAELTGKGNWEKLLSTAPGRGFISVILGLFGMIGSGILFVHKPGRSNLTALPGRIAGVLLFCISLLFIAIGGLWIVAPQNLLDMIKHYFTRP